MYQIYLLDVTFHKTAMIKLSPPLTPLTFSSLTNGFVVKRAVHEIL